MGKLFVIGEIALTGHRYSDGTPGYKILPNEELVALRDDSPALVRREQLRYGDPNVGDRFFSVVPDGIEIIEAPCSFQNIPRLIIDPYRPAAVPDVADLEHLFDGVKTADLLAELKRRVKG